MSVKDMKGPVALESGLPRLARKAGRNEDYDGEDVDVVFDPRAAKRAKRPSENWLFEKSQSNLPPRPGGDRPTGFSTYSPARAREASTGAGPDVGYDYEERRSMPAGDYGDSFGPSTSGGTDHDEGSADLFDQPSRRPRQEYRDLAEPTDFNDDAGELYNDPEDYFDDVRSSPTVDLGEGRSPVRTPRDGTFARRGLK